MQIRFKCDKCGARFTADENQAGLHHVCLCGTDLIIPASSDDYFLCPKNVTPGQKTRYERINETLRTERGVPTYEGPLWTYDESEVVLREPQEVARRLFALWAVSLRGDGVSSEELWSDFLDRGSVWPWTTLYERLVLDSTVLDPDVAQQLVWRVESMWVLMWALGQLPDLSWPDGYCDTQLLIELVIPARDDPAFIEKASLRSKSEILDAQELTMRLHWALNDAWLNQRQIPSNLDWKNPAEMIAPAPTLAGRLIEERHHALNWLVRFGNQEWDDVDTPT